MKMLKQNKYRMCIRTLVWAGVLFALIMSVGCRSREGEFLEGALKGVTETPLPSQTDDWEMKANDVETQKEEAASDPASGQTDGPDAEEAAAATPAASEEPEERIFVDVCGAVVSPGVYELEADSRVFQAIEAAGGFLPEAAGEYVNRAEPLEDGQQIYIPTREEAEKEPDLKSPLEQSSAGQEAGSSPGDAGQAADKVNLNTADAAALTTLTGIGESKAQAILAYREEHGGFSAIEEILNVPGIKEGTFVKIKDDIAVE